MSDGLNLEKMRIAERLTTLETQQKIFIDTMGDNIEKLNHIIIGNGKKGLAEEVRNLKEVHDKHKDYSKAAGIAIVGLVIKSTWDLFTGK